MDQGRSGSQPPPDRPLMAGVDREGSPGGTPAHGPQVGRFLGRRRTLLVDRAYQLRTALAAVIGVAFLFALAAALFHLLNLENAGELAARSPVLARGSGGDARTVLYLIAAGIVFVAAVFVIEILETHKTAGVVHKVTRALHDVEAGLWGSRIALRRHDNFREMEEAFNAAARGLGQVVEDDLHALQTIESQARQVLREFETQNREGALVLLRQIAGELQRLREHKRNLLRSASNGHSSPKI